MAGCGKRMGRTGDSISVYGTGTRFMWLTPWMLCLGMASVDFMMNMRGLIGSIQGKPAYQTASVVTELPDAATAITAGSYVTAASFTHFRETLGLTTKVWIRFGIAASNTTGSALGMADFELECAPRQCAEQVGGVSITINPGMISGTDVNYVEVPGWTPTSGLDKVMAGIVVLDNESTYLELQLVCRTAQDPRVPNAWQTCEAGYDNPAAGNSQRNTGALSAPAGANVSSNFLIQFGFAVRKKSGAAGNPRAQIHATVIRSNA